MASDNSRGARKETASHHCRRGKMPHAAGDNDDDDYGGDNGSRSLSSIPCQSLPQHGLTPARGVQGRSTTQRSYALCCKFKNYSPS